MRPRTGPRPRVDVGAALCAVGLAGPTFGLISAPRYGWGDPLVWGTVAGGLAVFAAFLAWEARHRDPMLPLGLFRRRNFAVGNVETFAMYAGLGVVFFFLVIYLQQVAGYEALQAGLATLPTTAIMFVLSKRAGAVADRIGPRVFMGAGPLVAAAGLLLLSRLPVSPDYWTDVLPGLVVFSLGLSATVAPLTATVLADADEHNAGIASGVNNAIARVAGLLATAALGALVAAQFGSALEDRFAGREVAPQTRAAVQDASRRTLGALAAPGAPEAERAELRAASLEASREAYERGLLFATVLVALGGVLGFAGIRNRHHEEGCEVHAEDCPGGQIAGVAGAGAALEEPSPDERETVPAAV